MSLVPNARVFTSRRTIPLAIVAALLAVTLLGVLGPSARAAPTPPFFSPAVQVDQAPAYAAGTPTLAMGSDGWTYVAFAAWGGPVTGTDVFFSKSRDGRTWTGPVRVNNDAGGASQSEPSLTLDASNNIYLAWTDTRNGNNDVFFSKSTDSGLSFSANVRVNDVTTNSQSEPSIAVDPTNNHVIHVVWTDTRSAVNGADIFYINSTDGGLSFNPVSLRINTDATAVEQGAPHVAVAPDRSVDIVWRDPRNAAKGPDIYFAKSADVGATWTPPVIVNDDSGAAAQTEPRIAVNETGAIFVAWTDSRSANTAPDVYATRSTNGGASFAANVRVNDDQGPVQQSTPSLAVRGSRVQLAWQDFRRGGPYPYDVYTSSSANGLTWSPNVRVTADNTGTFALNPAVGLDAAGDIVVAWTELKTIGPFTEQRILASVLDLVAPSAVAGPAASVDQGASASFDGSGSTDNLGIASSEWNFGDGSKGSGLSATHAYPNAGTYTAILTVWDYSGNMASSTRAITVRDTTAPVPRGGGDRTVEEGQALFFDGSASSDNVGVTSYLWDFGDGSTATTATATHVYAKAGTYSAKLTVTDAAGNAATTPFTATVRSSALLSYVELLGGIVGILVILVGILAWMLLGMRKKGREQGTSGAVMPGPRNAPPPQPRDSDPLDMTFPPSPPPRP
jgi:chitodextrinase